MIDRLFEVDALHSWWAVPNESSAIIDDAAAAFIEAPKATLVKRDIPEAIVDRFKADVLLDEGVTHGHAVVLPANSPVAADAAHFGVAGILRHAEPSRQRSWRRTVDRGRGLLV
jgi:hypothetical protein